MPTNRGDNDVPASLRDPEIWRSLSQDTAQTRTSRLTKCIANAYIQLKTNEQDLREVQTSSDSFAAGFPSTPGIDKSGFEIITANAAEREVVNALETAETSCRKLEEEICEVEEELKTDRLCQSCEFTKAFMQKTISHLSNSLYGQRKRLAGFSTHLDNMRSMRDVETRYLL